jgi:hypothetical protein
MKKLFLVLAVASLGFVACNNESETSTEVDSTTIVDSPLVAPPVVDSLAGKDSILPSDTSVKK